MGLNKILAAGITCCLLSINQQKCFSEENIKEYKKYETLFLSDYSQGLISLEWDNNTDGKADLSRLYFLYPIEGLKDFFDLGLVGKKEDNETNNQKYMRMLLKMGKGGLALCWYKDEISSFPNKQYYYKHIKFDESNRGVYQLEAIQEDKNEDKKFEEEEFTYQTREFEERNN